jgi:hypothetical protein
MKWATTGKNGKTDNNGQQRAKTGNNGQKRENGQQRAKTGKRATTGKNGQKRATTGKTGKNGLKWAKIDGVKIEHGSNRDNAKTGNGLKLRWRENRDRLESR